VNIVSYIQKFKRHPVTGEPLALRDVISLNFAKNSEGQYHCPVLHKVIYAAALLCCALRLFIFIVLIQASKQLAEVKARHVPATQVFTESTHIVAVRPTGNVYCYEVSIPLRSGAYAISLRCSPCLCVPNRSYESAY
jgi:peptidyl-prolyl cis-trans isomerase-like 2